MIGCIYKLTSPTGKVYIGRTTDFKRRMRQYTHKSRATDSPIYIEINKYGFDQFKKEILQTINGDKAFVNAELNRLEEYYILMYDSVNKGLNCYRWDSNSRESTINKKAREKMSISQTGRKHSEESKQKRAGVNAYQAKKVRSKTLGKTFNTLREAALYAGISNGCKVSECIAGKRKAAGKHPVTGEPIRDWEYI